MTARRSPSFPSRGTEAHRLHGLLEAHRIITADLSLRSMLDRIVSAACDLVGARYGAVGVLASDGSLEHFVHHGMPMALVSRIGELPRGRGLLGAVLDVPDAVRVDDLTQDGRSGGFPPGHPPMRSFLGVPIRVRGAAFGELYLADPAVGLFTEDDEDLVTALAASAGSAIENARLYDQAQRSTDWLNASGEIARTLLADADEEVLMDVVSRALDIAGADYAGLIMPTDGGRLRVTFTRGAGGEDFLGYEFDPVASPLGRAIIAGESICTPDLMNWAKDDFVNRWDFGPAMLVPLADSDGARGAVLMIRHSKRAGFGADDVMQASTFAAQVALALQLNDARADAEWLRVLEDRHRIAQDLHDNVMQRLFATGVGLQALADQRLDPDTGSRLRRYIADLDETIEQIRNRVFGLRANGTGGRRGRRGRFLRARPQPSDMTKVAQPAVLRSLSTARMHSEGPPEVSA